MVLVTFTIVVLRYAFNMGWIAMQESVTYMHALVFLMGAAYTLKSDGHVRVDIFYRTKSAKYKALIDFLGSLLLLLPVSLFIAWVSFSYVAESWSILEGSREAGGIPFVYLLKSGILIMAVLLVLQAGSEAIKKGLVLLVKE